MRKLFVIKDLFFVFPLKKRRGRKDLREGRVVAGPMVIKGSYLRGKEHEVENKKKTRGKYGFFK